MGEKDLNSSLETKDSFSLMYLKILIQTLWQVLEDHRQKGHNYIIKELNLMSASRQIKTNNSITAAKIHRAVTHTGVHTHPNNVPQQS